jgi:hypothetical protein
MYVNTRQGFIHCISDAFICTVLPNNLAFRRLRLLNSDTNSDLFISIVLTITNNITFALRTRRPGHYTVSRTRRLTIQKEHLAKWRGLCKFLVIPPSTTLFTHILCRQRFGEIPGVPVGTTWKSRYVVLILV